MELSNEFIKRHYLFKVFEIESANKEKEDTNGRRKP